MLDIPTGLAYGGLINRTKEHSTMRVSREFATTLATLAAMARDFRNISPEQAVDFAWFSVNSVGDAVEVPEDFTRHWDEWVQTW